jgi:hypothetical protein
MSNYDPDMEFQPGWQPPKYAPLREDATGMWTPVLDDAGGVIAVMWTDEVESAGIKWILQPPYVTEIYKHFSRCKSMNVPPGPAYRLARDTPGAKFGPEQTGPLSGVNELMTAADEERFEAQQ